MSKKIKQIAALLLSFMLIISMAAVVSFSASAAQTDNANLGATSDEAVVGEDEGYLKSGDFLYIVNEEDEELKDGTATITHYTGKAKEVTVPSEVDGHTVVCIYTLAFSENNAIEKVTIPDTVTHIYSSAFDGCKNLKEIKLSNNLTYLSSCAFLGCAVKEITLPKTLTDIGGLAFAECKNLEKVTIPDGVTRVGDDAFTGTGLTSVTIPASVERIGYQAFGYNDYSAESKVEDFKIYGCKGTAAETYSKENGFTFIDLDSINTYTDNTTSGSATPDSATPDSPSASNDTQNSTDNTAVQTGATAPTVLLLVVLTSALAAVYFYKRKIS